MELWIRSQNRRHLMKISNLEYDIIDQGLWFIKLVWVINGYSANKIDSLNLGYYATEKRCLEILDEIQKLLNPQVVFTKIEQPIAENCDGTVFTVPIEYEIKELSTYVYEMPQE